MIEGESTDQEKLKERKKRAVQEARLEVCFIGHRRCVCLLSMFATETNDYVSVSCIEFESESRDPAWEHLRLEQPQD